jgi:flavin-dependent dehydrogenase
MPCKVVKLPTTKLWTGTGDAAAGFDPFSAPGISHAISSGIHSARVAEASLRKDQTIAAIYR